MYGMVNSQAAMVALDERLRYMAWLQQEQREQQMMLQQEQLLYDMERRQMGRYNNPWGVPFENHPYAQQLWVPNGARANYAFAGYMPNSCNSSSGTGSVTGASTNIISSSSSSGIEDSTRGSGTGGSNSSNSRSGSDDGRNDRGRHGDSAQLQTKLAVDRPTVVVATVLASTEERSRLTTPMTSSLPTWNDGFTMEAVATSDRCPEETSTATPGVYRCGVASWSDAETRINAATRIAERTTNWVHLAHHPRTRGLRT
ncbi:hypothetical protein LSAT2_012088 [Lamellibrachia satsuma]|nr:hypothetical protein LSAT2_012088 [Lamellibrachia satsuma]